MKAGSNKQTPNESAATAIDLAALNAPHGPMFENFHQTKQQLFAHLEARPEHGGAGTMAAAQAGGAIWPVRAIVVSF